VNYVEIEDQITNIAQIIRRCPTFTLTRALGRAYRDWACQTQYLRVAIPGATVADTRLYDLGSDPYIEIVAVLAVQANQPDTVPLQYWALSPSDSSLWNPNYQPQQPTRYCYVPQAQIALDPIPDRVYDLLVSAIVQPKENAAQIPETGLTKYRSGIEAGALAYLHSLPGQPWSDPQQAMLRMREFQSSVNNAKAEVQRGFNTGSVRARPRGFMRR
jgi:hypothetical protein